MTRKHEKLLQKARRHKKGWQSRDLIALLKGYGFELSTTNGSHHTFKHEDCKLLMTVKHPDELAEGYIKQAVELIEIVIKNQKG